MDLFLFLLYILLCVSGFLVKKSKILTVVIFSYAWVLIGWNYDNSDYSTYQNIYIDSIFYLGFVDIGYLFLCEMFDFLGCDYASFRIITSGIVMIIYVYILLKYASFSSCVASCYLAFIFILDVTQIRNLIAFSFVFLGFSILLFGSKKVKLKYILCVLLASTIHISSIFYLVFFDINRKKYNIYWFGLFFITEVLIVKTLPILFGGYVESKFKDYTFETSLLTIFLASLVQFFNVYYIYIVGKSREIKHSNINYIDSFYNLNLLLLFMIPFYFDSLTYMRIFRNIAVLNFLYITNILSLHKSNNYVRMITFIVYASYFFLLMNLMHNFENIFIPVFEYNNFMDLFYK